MYELRDGAYALTGTFTRDETIASVKFPDMTIDLKPVFDFPLDDDEKKLFEVKESPAKYKV